MMGSRQQGAPPVRREENQKDIEVEADKVGLIIGKAGGTIRAIQDATGVYISVNRDPPPDGRPVRILTLKGTESQIAAGEVEVIRVGNGGRVGVPGSEGTMGFAAQGGGGGMGGGPPGGFGGGGPRMGGPGLGYGAASGGHEETMSVLAPTIGLVIGRGGETIRSVIAQGERETTGCGSCLDLACTLVAHSLLFLLCTVVASPFLPLDSGIQDRTGCSVQVQREEGPEPGMKQIKLVGSADACARARAEIEAVVAATREMGGQGLGAGYQGVGGPRFGGGGGVSQSVQTTQCAYAGSAAQQLSRFVYAVGSRLFVSLCVRVRTLLSTVAALPASPAWTAPPVVVVPPALGASVVVPVVSVARAVQEARV